MTTIYRNRFVEIACPSHSAATLTLSNYDDYDSLAVGFLYLTFYLKLPKFLRGDFMDEAYGFYFGEDSLVLEWNKERLFLYYPWSFVFHKRSEWVELDNYGTMKGYWIEMPRRAAHGALATKQTLPFTYTLKSGELQERHATIYQSKMEWRRRWWKWLKLGQKISTTINVQFSGEVGEKTGSWKGGVVGAGYEMLAGESPTETLARMQRDWRC